MCGTGRAAAHPTLGSGNGATLDAPWPLRRLRDVRKDDHQLLSNAFASTFGGKSTCTGALTVQEAAHLARALRWLPDAAPEHDPTVKDVGIHRSPQQAGRNPLAGRASGRVPARAPSPR